MPTLPFNYHMHSRYDDGQNDVADYAAKAVALGMTSIGTSGHAPVPFDNEYAIRLEALPSYIADVRKIQADYAHQLEIALGLEVDVIPGLQQHFLDFIVPHGFDFFIGSVHFIGTRPDGQPWEFDAGAENFDWGWRELYNQDGRAMAEAFYASARMVPDFIPGIQIVGHMDRIKRFNYVKPYIDEDARWYRELVDSALEVYAQHDIIVELNTAGCRKPTGIAYPSSWICQRCHELKIRMTINTDAHDPEHLDADHIRGIEQLRSVGYRELWMRQRGQWVATALPE